MVTLRLSPSLAEELELVLDEPLLVERALTELCAELCDELCDWAPCPEPWPRLLLDATVSPGSATQLSLTRPSAE